MGTAARALIARMRHGVHRPCPGLGCGPIFCRGATGPVLPRAQGGCAGRFALHAHGGLQGHVLAQRAVIVQAFPARCQPVYPLAQHAAHAVPDQQRAARISAAACRRSHQAELAIDLAQQHHAAIAGHAAPVESSLHPTLAPSAKVQRSNVHVFATVWLRHCPRAGSRFGTSIVGLTRAMPSSSPGRTVNYAG